jgi:hypothetical protein
LLGCEWASTAAMTSCAVGSVPEVSWWRPCWPHSWHPGQT